MVRFNRVYDRGGFLEAFEYLHAYGNVGALYFVVDGFAYVVQKSRPSAHFEVRAQLRCQRTCEIADFKRVFEHVLPVTGAVFESSQKFDYFGVQTVYASVERGVLSRFLHLVIQLAAHFFDSFFYARGVYSAVRHKAFYGEFRHFPSYGVERGNGHHVRRVVNDKVDARAVFYGADIPAHPADEPALHLVAGQLHRGYAYFGRVVHRATLYRLSHDVARALFRFVLCALFDFTRLFARVLAHFVQKLFHKLRLCLFLGELRHFFKLFQHFIVLFGKFALYLRNFLLFRLYPLLAVVEGRGFFVEKQFPGRKLVFPLGKPVFRALQLRPALPGFLVQFGTHFVLFFLDF